MVFKKCVPCLEPILIADRVQLIFSKILFEKNTSRAFFLGMKVQVFQRFKASYSLYISAVHSLLLQALANNVGSSDPSLISENEGEVLN